MFTQIKKWNDKPRSDRLRIGFIILMQSGFVVAFFIALYEKSWITTFVSLLALAIVWLPSILERNFRTHFPLEFELLLNVFIYSSLFLGEMQGFYTKFWWWDLVLHASSGIALGFLGFLILFSLYRSKKLGMSPSLLSLFSFCFAIALGSLWEIFEFTMDNLFGLNMQKSGLIDTMWDLIVNAGGAFLASVSGYFYLLKRKGIGVLKYFIDLYFPQER